ncbi:MAG: long-chain fatty acid--CoA ligase [Bryobacter sp.]|nr:long-chain fatty acid--CoA ligase [Bryobacter sp.]
MSGRTVYTVLEEVANKFPERPALHQPVPGTNGEKFDSLTWGQYAQAVREIAVALRSLGIQRGDVVALQSETRLEFYLADLGILANGSIAAALYTSYPQGEAVQKLRNCSAKLVFVENPKMLATLTASAASSGGLDIQWVLMTGSADDILSLSDLRAKGREILAEDPKAFARIYLEVEPEDPAIIYLTSGSTGEPKMGVVPHRAIVYNLEIAPPCLPLTENDRTIAFLPSAHITQRLVMEMLPMAFGMAVYFSESLARLPKEIQALKPTFLVAPPRLWERIYQSILAEIKKKPPFLQKIFHGGLGLGLKAKELKWQGKGVPPWISGPLALVDGVIFSKVRARLGGELRIAVSGSAPLGKDLASFYQAIGVNLIEGFGLTEGGVTHLNPLDKPKAGSIGKLFPGVEAKLMEDGELALAGGTVFTGYYRDAEATGKVFAGKWLLTGDIASMDEEGYWYITGRKKEILVASNGKKIYPARIESLFKAEPAISQVVLVGDKRPFVTALVTMSEAALEQSGKDATAVVSEMVRTVNRKVESHEQIRKFKILPKEFSMEAGEITPTMKVRKGIILERYSAEISELYAGKEELE